MRLERMDVRDMEGCRWSVAGDAERVTGWWSRSEGRAHRFASFCGAIAEGNWPACRNWEGRKVELLELTLSTQEGKIRVFHDPKTSADGWTTEASDRASSRTLAEPAVLRESHRCLWRVDRADEIAAWFVDLTRDRMDQDTVTEGGLTDRRRYEEAIEEALRLRGLLDEAMAERDRLRSLWQTERDEEHQRVQEWRRQLAEFDKSLGEVDARRASLLDEIREIERREDAMRRELRERPAFKPATPKRQVISASEIESIRRQLHRIDLRVISWRKAQERLDIAIGKVRGELAAVAISEDLETTQSFERIRRDLFGFETAAEEVLSLRRKLDASEITESKRKLPSSEKLKTTCEHLYEELHRLHERMVRRQAALARREISSRLRRLRRLHRELSGHLDELLEHRSQVIAGATRQGITSAHLAEATHTGCHHCGHSAHSVVELHEADHEPERVTWLTDRRRDELVEALREAAERLRVLRIKVEEIDAERSQIALRRQDWERHLRHWELERLPSELAMKLDAQRQEIERLEGLRRKLLEAIANYERYRETCVSAVLDRLSPWVDRLSAHHWCQVVLSRDESELELIDRRGQHHRWSTLDTQDRTTIAAGLVLGWNAQRSSQGVWPTIMVLPRAIEIASSLASETLAASARLGAPIWVVGESSETVSQWVSSDSTLEIPTWVSAPIARPTSSMPLRLLVTRSNNIDAEEFPGEFRDQVALEHVDGSVFTPGQTLDERWRAEDRVEAYATGTALSRVENPEAWISQLLGDEESSAKPATRVAWSSLPLEGDAMMSTSLVRWLAQQGITSWGALADADIQALKKRQGLVAWNDRIEAWHATAKLLCRAGVPGVFDARVLAACEVTEPKEMDRYPAYELLKRIRALGAHEEGRRLLAAGTDEELTRLCGWVSSLEHTRSLREFGYRDSTEKTEPSTSKSAMSAESDSDSSHSDSSDSDVSNHSTRHASRSERVSKRESNVARRGKASSSQRATLRFDPAAPRVPMDQNDRRRRLAGAARDEQGERLRFYLELDSDVESAPSIGAKGAQRLRSLGIKTIEDFLAADVTELAAELDLPRIDASTLTAWQRQSELVLRVPNLRGYQAQLLVAAGVMTAEALRQADAHELWERVSTLTRTTEGKRILRESASPTAADVKGWIRWSRHTRSVRVA